MENIKYIEDGNYEKKVDKAINDAIANLAMEGFVVSNEERMKIKEEFLNNYKVKILVKKRGNKD